MLLVDLQQFPANVLERLDIAQVQVGPDKLGVGAHPARVRLENALQRTHLVEHPAALGGQPCPGAERCYETGIEFQQPVQFALCLIVPAHRDVFVGKTLPND